MTTYKVKIERRENADGSLSLSAPPIGHYHIRQDDYDGSWCYTEPHGVQVAEGGFESRADAEYAAMAEINRVIREE